MWVLDKLGFDLLDDYCRSGSEQVFLSVAPRFQDSNYHATSTCIVRHSVGQAT
jgi:hypothetical protein